jgi:hypothetical protein
METSPYALVPSELAKKLDKIIAKNLMLSVFIWGPPGVGKSSIVGQLAETHGLEVIDLRLSQLGPTDIRGLPAAHQGSARWYPPSFLPTKGRGILFLDEFNMATSVMQGIAQQLVLDRKVGSYTVPDEWFIWAAGNRKEDAAAVFEMTGPMQNRYVHFHINADVKDQDFVGGFLSHVKTFFHPDVVAFLRTRPGFIYKMDQTALAWPSPRSWEMASELHTLGLEVEPAVGPEAGKEFQAFAENEKRKRENRDPEEEQALHPAIADPSSITPYTSQTGYQLAPPSGKKPRAPKGKKTP